MEQRRAYVDEIKTVFSRDGLDGVAELVRNNICRWRGMPMDIAVTGNSGTGKSTFINAIRGLTADDPDAAKVGEVETTMKATPYIHPTKQNLRFWDLPGVGTPTFPKDSYCKVVNFDSYDIVLILSQDRLTENDIWLGKQVRRFQKPFIFIRTKMDNSVDNDRRAHTKTHNKDALLARIFGDCERQFADAGFNDVECYLISSYVKTAYDYNRLEQRLNDLRAEAAIILCTAAFEDIVTDNAAVLPERVKRVSLLAGRNGMVIGAGLSKLIDKKMIKDEVNFIRNHIGMDDTTLEILSTSASISLREIKRCICRQNRYMSRIEAEIATFVDKAAEEKSWIAFVPIVGMYSNATVSASTQSFLIKKISELGKDMINVYVYAMKCIIKANTL